MRRAYWFGKHYDLSDVSGTSNAGDVLVGTGSGYMGMSIDTDSLTEGSTNLYYTTARANADFDTRFAQQDTDDLSEGTTNLYYTDARARAAVSLTSTNTSELSYDSATGVFS